MRRGEGGRHRRSRAWSSAAVGLVAAKGARARRKKDENEDPTIGKDGRALGKRTHGRVLDVLSLCFQYPSKYIINKILFKSYSFGIYNTICNG